MFGEWNTEPNRVEFEHEGLKCLVVRNDSMKHLCGYVALPEDHPYFEKEYMSIDVNVHGGLTFGRGGMSEKYKDENYYKETHDENGKRLWWIGFDCAHAGDFTPSEFNIQWHHGRIPEYEKYRNLQYVVDETKHLAQQLGVIAQHSYYI